MKQRVYLGLEDPFRAQGIARVFGIFLIILITLNALVVGVDDAPPDARFSSAFAIFNIFSTIVFGVEYVLRLWIADKVYPTYTPVRARIRYARSLMGIIDLLSFLPMIIIWFVPETVVIADAVRIIRLVRLIKISRYMRGLKSIHRVIEKRSDQIVAAFMVLALLCIVASVLMYQAEHDAQPEQFDSVFTGLYWAMTTMTSTGYGDLVPITPLGRIIGFFVMALSIGVVAIPAGIFSAGFVAEFNSEKNEEDATASEDTAAGNGDGVPGDEALKGATDADPEC